LLEQYLSGSEIRDDQMRGLAATQSRRRRDVLKVGSDGKRSRSGADG
jgi:hypothetical protein